MRHLALVSIALAATAAIVVTSRQAAVAQGAADARLDFVAVAVVLTSPRCKNCHPSGDRPLRGDTGEPHLMNVSRRSPDAGLSCAACHRGTNARMRGGPPGVPGWHMPSAATPMVFEGRSPSELCTQLKDSAKNGGKSIDALLDHLERDPLVLWGWAPGPGRTVPPISHPEMVGRAKRWAAAGAPCP